MDGIAKFAIAAVGMFVLAGAILTLPTWLLWNWLAPAIFGLPSITLLQALGLVVLCNCLFNAGSSSGK